MTIELRKKHDHPFRPVPVYRAYQILDDGSEFNLRLAHESADELSEIVKRSYSGGQEGLRIGVVE